jgi:tRNA A-37 threonylcarbamoyl transferase component Bud32/rRNA maturation endonuclease Nob1
MAAGNEILFGRIAVYNRIVSAGDLEDSLEFQRTRSPSSHIAQVLLERGLIDEAQSRAILAKQRRTLHRAAKPGREAMEERLVDALVKQGDLDLDAVSRARAVQSEMEERGLFPALGDILVQQGAVGFRKYAEAVAKISRSALRCEECGKRYRAVGYRPGKEARCRKCGGRLEPDEPFAPAPGYETELAAVPEPSEKAPEPPEAQEEEEPVLPPELREQARPAAGPFRPRAGDALGGCVLEERLGVGGMGEIYRGRDLALDRPVAVKILSPKQASMPHVVQRFLSEARAAARLEHPNIVVVHKAGEERGINFIIMQLVRGKSVRDILREKGPFPVPESLSIVGQAAAGLDYAHRQQMVHRDVKPANVMIDEAGRVTIVDFGLTKNIASDSSLTTDGFVVGTVHYISPEHAAGRRIDGRSDLYGLGVTWFEMLAGRVPFVADTPWKVLLLHQREPAPDVRAYRPEVPDKVAHAVARLLEKDPDERFASGEQLTHVIEDIRRLLRYEERTAGQGEAADGG